MVGHRLLHKSRTFNIVFFDRVPQLIVADFQPFGGGTLVITALDQCLFYYVFFKVRYFAFEVDGVR